MSKAKALKGLLDLLKEQAEKGEASSVMPAPQRFFDPNDKAFKPFLGEFGPTPGGRYLTKTDEGMQDITGQYPSAVNISVDPSGRPTMLVSNEPFSGEAPTGGRKIKTNLAKSSAGWKWNQAPEGYDPGGKGQTIVSVQDGNKHLYALNAEFPEGAELARYEKSATEPRLRPTRQGNAYPGEKVGEISMRGKSHPVYDNITIKQLGGAGLTGLLGAAAMTPEEAEASFVGMGSRIGRAAQDMYGMAQKMEAEGMPEADIHRLTGWSRGADGMWRIEHDNRNTVMTPIDQLPVNEPISIDRVINDPALLGGYREGMNPLEEGLLKIDGSTQVRRSPSDIKVIVDDSMRRGDFGSYHPHYNTISLNKNMSPEKARHAMLHELQHGIQEFEGFSTGSSPGFIVDAQIGGPPYSDWAKALDPSGTRLPFENYVRVAGEVEAENVATRDQGQRLGLERGARPDQLDMRNYAPSATETLGFNKKAASREDQFAPNPDDYDELEAREAGGIKRQSAVDSGLPFTNQMDKFDRQLEQINRRERQSGIGAAAGLGTAGLLGAAILTPDAAMAGEMEEAIASDLQESQRWQAGVDKANESLQSDDPEIRELARAWLDEAGLLSDDRQAVIDARAVEEPLAYDPFGQPIYPSSTDMLAGGANYAASAAEGLARDVGGSAVGIFSPEMGRSIKDARSIPMGTEAQEFASRVANPIINAGVGAAVNELSEPVFFGRGPSPMDGLIYAATKAEEAGEMIPEGLEPYTDRAGNAIVTAAYAIPALRALMKAAR